MYFPYIRSKQFDLLALKELTERQLLHPSVIPLIEPIKDSAALKRTITSFIKHEQPLAIIANPEVGEFDRSQDKLHDIDELKLAPTILPAFITNQLFTGSLISGRHNLLITNRYTANLSQFQSLTSDYEISHISIQDPRMAPLSQAISLHDPLTVLKNVEDYLYEEDEFFSDDHLFYLEDGFQGFSDYSINGATYEEKGFPAKAVALHILYFDAYQNLRIKHFTSDNNQDYTNPGGKFLEAANKLARWYQKYQDQLVLTYGLSELLLYQQNQKFPGLGVIKKLSLMHHLELVSRYFQQVLPKTL
ncbi:sce7725 family protein [Vagococcus sp. BWB3-3]|uniref:Sce7725 family protein n=1 Tax=Vagococcus allomyrinae TaxID=2794353 RepID=A0A940SWU4_9ENTE|nr:sce7725 family protein [Vagococcus allomyrinae]MBP1043364.1 sce7725 family protein [Vagococcus allomyrinae]